MANMWCGLDKLCYLHCTGKDRETQHVTKELFKVKNLNSKAKALNFWLQIELFPCILLFLHCQNMSSVNGQSSWIHSLSSKDHCRLSTQQDMRWLLVGKEDFLEVAWKIHCISLDSLYSLGWCSQGLSELLEWEVGEQARQVLIEI